MFRKISNNMILILSLLIAMGATSAVQPYPSVVFAAAKTITAGEASILKGRDSGKGNLLVAQKTTLAGQATLQSLSFYVSRAAGQLVLGIYSDANGAPGTLLASTPAFTPVLGWNTRNVTAPVSLAAGTYWLAHLPSSNDLESRSATSGSSARSSFPFGALPSSFPSSPALGSSHWSFYATLSLNAAPTATSTFRPTATSTPKPTGTSTPSATATHTLEPTATFTLEPPPTLTLSPTAAPTLEPTATPTFYPSSTPTPTATRVLPLEGRDPLKASDNGRYLVDQNNVPFLIVGDSPHALIGNLSPADARIYLQSRHAAGVNAMWAEMFCSTYSNICPGYTTHDGIAPFAWSNNDPNSFDLSAPNEADFSRVDAIINLAAQNGITLFLDPTETGGWMKILQNNGATKARDFGVYLGNRFKNFPNIVWLLGNDFQTWRDPTDDSLIRAVAEGIQSVDTNHLQTVQLDYPTSASLNDPTWAPIIGLDSAYSYYSPYDQVLREYNRSSFMPVDFLEGVYEYQGYMGGYQGPHELRAQAYWTQLSGSAGVFYGNANLYSFPTGWQSAQNPDGSNWQTSPGILQLGYFRNLFQDRPWYNLVPDQSHSVVTTGYGTYQSISAQVMGNTSDYATTAMTADGTLAITYMPTIRTITVDMSKFASAVQAQWCDPTNGTYVAISGSPFANSGLHPFTPAGSNSEGSGDWVLVLEANGPPSPTESPTPLPSSTPTAIPPAVPPTAPSTPTDVPTATSTNPAVPTLTSTATASTIVIGETNILGTDDSGNGNLLVAQKTSLSQPATIRSLSFYVSSVAGNLRLGIYDDASGKPNRLVAFTPEITPVPGWNTQSVTSPVALPAGTYWLAYLPQSSNLHFRLAHNGTAVWYSYPYAALPATFSSSVNLGTYHWSFYGSLTP